MIMCSTFFMFDTYFQKKRSQTAQAPTSAGHCRKASTSRTCELFAKIALINFLPIDNL